MIFCRTHILALPQGGWFFFQRTGADPDLRKMTYIEFSQKMIQLLETSTEDIDAWPGTIFEPVFGLAMEFVVLFGVRSTTILAFDLGCRSQRDIIGWNNAYT